MKEPIFGSLAEALLQGFSRELVAKVDDKYVEEAECEPSKAYRVASLELSALQESGMELPEEIVRHLPRIISMWVETDNPTFIDQALLLCLKYRFPLINCLAVFLEDVCHRRCASLPFAARQTAKSAENSSYDYQVHLWLANLHAAGVQPKQAAMVAAHLFAKKFPWASPYKASSLKKDYHRKMRQMTVQGVSIADLARQEHQKHPYLTYRWLKIAEDFKECPPELIGTRGNETDKNEGL